MSSEWKADGMSQLDLMLNDQCIVVNNDDIIIGGASKYDAHVFSKETPRGTLHRAFSVFLFNNEGKLLLQQRDKAKITFPNVWTNTCCSHPLHGQTPSEVDSDQDLFSGKCPGAKAAAIRKLAHELGIPREQLFAGEIKFLTRLHYWAADVVTHGMSSPWGEHEIDYVLFIRANVTCTLNPEEVSAVQYVTQAELKKLMDPASGLLWSPWFRIIAERFLPAWWENLDVTFSTNKFVDVKTIHRFDPTMEHMGGAGSAGPYLNLLKDAAPNGETSKAGDKSLKQGAYGKIQIHKHSKISQLIHFEEVVSALYLLYGNVLEDNLSRLTDINIVYCNDILGKVSRSFAGVIRQLPEQLAIDIMVFYLVLRALDTIEDDMETFKDKINLKFDYLTNFYRTALVESDWCLMGVGEGDERLFLEEFYRCTTVFKTMSISSQEVIADITKRMGEGMSLYAQKDLGQGTVLISDYDMYCHYVAGLVGEGLSRLFTCSGLENNAVAEVSTTLANTMGLFLQKTNIIRDYLEDYVDKRAFWPHEVWKHYVDETKANNLGLGDLSKPENRDRAVQCLNHLVTNALDCVPECLQYLSMLKTPEVFSILCHSSSNGNCYPR